MQILRDFGSDPGKSKTYYEMRFYNLKKKMQDEPHFLLPVAHVAVAVDAHVTVLTVDATVGLILGLQTWKYMPLRFNISL